VGLRRSGPTCIFVAAAVIACRHIGHCNPVRARGGAAPGRRDGGGEDVIGHANQCPPCAPGAPGDLHPPVDGSPRDDRRIHGRGPVPTVEGCAPRTGPTPCPRHLPRPLSTIRPDRPRHACTTWMRCVLVPCCWVSSCTRCCRSCPRAAGCSPTRRAPSPSAWPPSSSTCSGWRCS